MVKNACYTYRIYQLAVSASKIALSRRSSVVGHVELPSHLIKGVKE